MTAKETAELLKYISGAYPGKFNVTEAVLNVWGEALADQDFEGVMYRAKRHIAREEFPPTISKLKITRPPVIGGY